MTKHKQNGWICIRGHVVAPGEYYCLACVRQIRKPVPPAYYRKRRRESPYYKSEEYFANNRARVARYEKRNKHKKRCRLILNHAVQSSKLIRPDHCSKCGLVCKPQAHHRDYEKPLDVIWVCRDCHGIEDAKLSAVGRDLDGKR